MSKRQHTRENRLGLREALLRDCRAGVLAAGDALPPVRQLAATYGLSPATAQRVLRSLADEGVLNLRQGAGAYVGSLPEHTDCTFAAVFADKMPRPLDFSLIREGFEIEIARRGSSSLTLTRGTRGLPALLQNIADGEVSVRGALFVPSSNMLETRVTYEMVKALGDVPVVAVSFDPGPSNLDASRAIDTVRFDNVDGGRQAARHLWRRGHRKLAFLGLHTQSLPGSTLPWSVQRAAGFEAALNELKAEPLIFLPHKEPELGEPLNHADIAEGAAQALLPLLRSGEVQAVVCANQFAMLGLLKAARAAKLPEACWPALVAFDDQAHDDHLLSVLRVPWDVMGQAAAAALWERVFGTMAQREAPPHDIWVPLRLVSRLSCSASYGKRGVADAALASAAYPAAA